MDKPFSADIQGKLHALTRRISVAHELDAEIQEELYTHMEDKLLVYLSGEEAVTEDDALHLVQLHFGEPANLRGMLRQVHRQPAERTLLRRAAAAFIAFTATYASANLLLSAVQVGFASRAMNTGRTDGFLAFNQAGEHLSLFATLVIPLAILLYWQHRGDSDRAPWYLRWRPATLVGLCTAALAAAHIVPYPGDAKMWVLVMGPIPWWEDTLDRIAPVVMALQCLVWIGWCDSAPRTPQTATRGVVFWFAWSALISPIFFGLSAWGLAHAVPSAVPDGFPVPPDAVITVPFGSEYLAYLALHMPPIDVRVGMVASWVFYSLLLGVPAYMLYRGLAYLARLRNQEIVE